MNNKADYSISGIAIPLLSWWDNNKADLPWRRPNKADSSPTAGEKDVQGSKIVREAAQGEYRLKEDENSQSGPDGYAILVAEIMLQQTKVSTVIPYYQRWMERFPSFKELAAATLDEVLKQWQGLGYYSRARNLQRTAKLIESERGGRLPESAEELQELPGIGRYTAGAVASIAFGQQTAAVDGNAIRVVSRLIDYPEDVTSTGSRKKLWDLVERSVPEERPGDFNQGLMELGQRICLAKNPGCRQCPLREMCQSRISGNQLKRPVRPRRKGIPHYQVAAAVIEGDDGQVLITRRPLEGLLGGLWEFPGGKVEDGESLKSALERELLEELGIEVEAGEELTAVRHAYSHYRITLHALRARIISGEIRHLGVVDHSWASLNEIDRFPFSVTDIQIIDFLKTEREESSGK